MARWRTDFWITAGLLIFVTYLGFSLYPDLPANPFDELQIYFGAATRDFRIWLVSMQWSPLYVSWYALLHSLAPLGLSHVLALNQSLLPALLLATWFFFLRAERWTAPAAALVVIALALSPDLWAEGVKVHEFSLWVSTLAVIFLVRATKGENRYLWAALFCLPLVATRPELVLYYPLCLGLYWRFWRRDAGAEPRRPLWFLALLALSFAPLPFTQLFSGHKAGNVYFLKQFERHQEWKIQRDETATDLQRRLFPGATGPVSAFRVNPGEAWDHTLYQAKNQLKFVADFYRRWLEVSPVWFGFLCVTAMIAGCAAWLRLRRGEGRDEKSAVGRTIFWVMIFLLPQLVVAVTYGSLARYGTAIYFGLTSLLFAPLLFVSRRAQLGALVLGAFLGWAAVPSWRREVYGSFAPNYSRFYHSFSAQYLSLVGGRETKMLTDCGAIWRVVGGSLDSQYFFFFFDDHPGERFREKREEVMREFDAVVFCDTGRSPMHADLIRAYLESARKMKSDFWEFRLVPIDATVFVAKKFPLPPELPAGVSLE